MQAGKWWVSVEFMLGVVFLAIGLCARFAVHSADPRVLVLAPFGAGLILCETVTRLTKFAVARIANQRRGAR